MAAYEYPNRHGRSVRCTLFCYCRKLLIYQDIYIRRSKRGPPADSSSHKFNEKNGESENEGYKIYYCR